MMSLPLCDHVTVIVDGMVTFSEHVKVAIVAVRETICTSLSVDGELYFLMNMIIAS